MAIPRHGVSQSAPYVRWKSSKRPAGALASSWSSQSTSAWRFAIPKTRSSVGTSPAIGESVIGVRRIRRPTAEGAAQVLSTTTASDDERQFADGASSLPLCMEAVAQTAPRAGASIGRGTTIVAGEQHEVAMGRDQ